MKFKSLWPLKSRSKGRNVSPLDLYQVSRPDANFPFPVVVRVLLHVEYPAEYPDVIPNLTITAQEGEMSGSEEQALLDIIKNSVSGACLEQRTAYSQTA